MIISARVHYSCLALMELASQASTDRPLAASEISERHAIPGPFLNQILRTLRAAGWVQSSRGSQGGYRLIADPAKITLLDIVDAVGCQETPERGEANATVACQNLQEIWQAADEAARELLSQSTLAELVEKCRDEDAVMYFI